MWGTGFIFFPTWRIQFSQYLFWKRSPFPFVTWHLCHKLSDYVCSVCFKVSIVFSQPVFLALCGIHYCHCVKSWQLVGWVLQLCSSMKLWLFLNLCISDKFQNQFVNFQTKTTTKENPAGILIGITWTLEIILGETDIFTTPSATEYMERGHVSRTTGGRASGAMTGSQPLNVCPHCEPVIPFLGTHPHTTYIHAHTTYIHTCTPHVHAWTLHVHTCTHQYIRAPKDMCKNVNGNTLWTVQNGNKLKVYHH